MQSLWAQVWQFAALGNFLGELTGFYSIVFYAGIAVVIANFTKIGKFKISEDLASFMFGMYIFSLGANATLASIANFHMENVIGRCYFFILRSILPVSIPCTETDPYALGIWSHLPYGTDRRTGYHRTSV